ncbi:MAG: hypothetical protein WCO84_02080 [bacterium]
MAVKEGIHAIQKLCAGLEKKALYIRHELLVKEFSQRGYQHHTPLKKELAVGLDKQRKFINTIEEQKIILKQKECECLLF